MSTTVAAAAASTTPPTRPDRLAPGPGGRPDPARPVGPDRRCRPAGYPPVPRSPATAGLPRSSTSPAAGAPTAAARRRSTPPAAGGVVSLRQVTAPAGLTLATGSGFPDHAVQLWDLADPAHPHPLGEPMTAPNIVISVAFAAGRDILASGSLDGKARLYDVADPAHPRQIGQPLGDAFGVYSVLFAPNVASTTWPSAPGRARRRDGPTVGRGRPGQPPPDRRPADRPQPQRLLSVAASVLPERHAHGQWRPRDSAAAVGREPTRPTPTRSVTRWPVTPTRSPRRHSPRTALFWPAAATTRRYGCGQWADRPCVPDAGSAAREAADQSLCPAGRPSAPRSTEWINPHLPLCALTFPC
jgi:hypothetical protein